MAKNKTAVTTVKVNYFIDSFVDNDQKKKDSLELMEKWSGHKAKMWVPDYPTCIFPLWKSFVNQALHILPFSVK